MRIENEYIEVRIAEHGAEITSIRDKKADKELMWNADAKFWKRSAPVLFPNVGRVYGGTMHTDSGDFKLGQHGFARDQEFKCIESDASSAVFKLVADGATRSLYDYEFELTISYSLNGADIDIKWEVENLSNAKMPFTIGGHPAFAFGPDDPYKKDHYIYVPGLDVLKYKLLDPSCGCALPTEYSYELRDGYLQLCEEMFAKDALICDDHQISEAWLCNQNKQKMIGVKAEGFPNFGIWSVKDAPFVCLEPWHGRTDDVGYEGPYGEKRNAISLDPGETFTAVWKICTPGETK